MREPHVLSATKTMKMPRRLIYFDSEAKVHIPIDEDEVRRVEEGEDVRKEHHTYLICATYKHKTNSGSTQRIKRRYVTSDPKEFSDPAFCGDFWTDVERYARMNEHLYCFAHNAKYDVQVTGGVHYLVRMGYTVAAFSDENPFILTFEKTFTHSPETGKPFMRVDKLGNLKPDPRKKEITVVSSTNYYQQSLKSLGKVFGLEKLDFAHDQPFTMDDALTYCDRDVDILERAMDGFFDFVEREELGSFKLTVAGQAFAAFRHRFLSDEIFIHSTPEALEVERAAYAGGRTECFRIGEIPDEVYYVDVNSMYPFVMKNHYYPTKLVSHWDIADADRVRELIDDGYLVICHAYVKTEKPVYHKKYKRLIFPIGEFWTSLCTPELMYGIETGIITQVKNICIYEGGSFFEPYVDYFYEKRLEAKRNKDSVHDYLYKIFLNSLYGKFGQKNSRWEQVEPADPEEVEVYTTYDADTKQRVMYKVFGGWVWKRNDDGQDEEAYNSFPAVAAHVTAHARMLLWYAIETAGLDNVFYSDTDSIMCNKTGYENLRISGYLDEKELGKLKLEKTGKLHLFGCKDYVFNDETKIKGISKSARILEPTADGNLRFAVTQWGGFTDRLKNKDFSIYSNKVIIKTLRREYNKGNIIDGKVYPYRFNEEAELKRKLQLIYEKEIDDLFIRDHLKYWCNYHGYIKTVLPGERFYEEYRYLPRHVKPRYFRRDGIPIDIWADDIGKSVSELFDELNSK